MEAPLLWIDLEMSGLNLEKDVILEVAAIITTPGISLEELQHPTDTSRKPIFHRIIHRDQSILDSMDAWCTQHHRESGLTAAILESKHSLESVQSELNAFLEEWLLPEHRHQIVLCGNSVHVDKIFLQKEFPNLINDWLHYRIIDVSTIKELARRWYPQKIKNLPLKMAHHRAVDDIRESIQELLFYQQALFK